MVIQHRINQVRMRAVHSNIFIYSVTPTQIPCLSMRNRRKYRRMVCVVQDEKSGVCQKAFPLNLHGMG